MVDTAIMAKLKPFPNASSDGKILTRSFLDAASGILQIMNTFSPVFIPVIDDMHGNVKKLEKIYMENQIEYKYLNDMLLIEKRQMGCHARNALLWLRRGLELLFVFFNKVLKQHAALKVSQDLRPLLMQAYKETLEKFHGFRAKQMFKELMEKCPKYKDFLQIIGADNQVLESFVFFILPKYLDGIKCNTEAIYKFYEDNDLDLDDVS